MTEFVRKTIPVNAIDELVIRGLRDRDGRLVLELISSEGAIQLPLRLWPAVLVAVDKVQRVAGVWTRPAPADPETA